MTRLRLGLIGCGRVVEVQHLPVLRAMSDVEVVAVTDTDPVRLDPIGRFFDVTPSKRYTDYRRLLDDAGVDAVSIYEGGLGEINVSWGQGWGGTQLMGTRGRLIYAYNHMTSVNYERPDRLVLVRDGQETDVAFPAPAPFSEGPFRQFVAAVLHGRPLAVTGADGRAAVEIALAAYESAALGRPVDLPLSASDPVYRHGVRGLSQLTGADPAVLSLYNLIAETR